MTDENIHEVCHNCSAFLEAVMKHLNQQRRHMVGIEQKNIEMKGEILQLKHRLVKLEPKEVSM